MSTISNKSLVCKIIDHNGDCNYGEGPKILAEHIVEYTSGFNTTAYKVLYSSRDPKENLKKFLSEGSVVSANVIWSQGGLTPYGKSWYAITKVVTNRDG